MPATRDNTRPCLCPICRQHPTGRCYISPYLWHQHNKPYARPPSSASKRDPTPDRPHPGPSVLASATDQRLASAPDQRGAEEDDLDFDIDYEPDVYGDEDDDYQDEEEYEEDGDEPTIIPIVSHEASGDSDDELVLTESPTADRNDTQDQGHAQSGPTAIADGVERPSAVQLANLPIPIHQFPHHDLESMERVGYAEATFLSVTGGTLEQVRSHLEYSQLWHRRSDPDGTQPTPTGDPYRAYKLLGVHPDDKIERFAVCSNRDCRHVIAYSDLEAKVDDVHLTPSGRRCGGKDKYYFPRSSKPQHIMTFIKPSTMLQEFFRMPIFAEEVQHWRCDEDDITHGVQAPDSAALPQDVKLHSVADGPAWRSLDANSRREVHIQAIKDISDGAPQRLVSLEYGLVLCINLDFFTVKDVIDHSIGAVYLSVLNLPRNMSTKPQWTMLCMIIPGPKHPTGAAISNMIEPLVDNLVELERGIMMQVANHDTPQLIKAQVLFSASDLPATRSLGGIVGIGANRPCNICKIHRRDISKPAGFDWRSAELWDDEERLNQMAKHRGAASAVQNRIEADFGVRWTQLARLSSFRPSSFAPPDSMHNVLIGMTRALTVWLSTSNKFADECGDRREEWDTAFASIIWPSHIGRIPSRVVHQTSSGGEASSIKADEWARVRTAMPAVLFRAWMNPATFSLAKGDDHDRSALFSAIVEFCAATRTFLARAISSQEAINAQDLFCQACKRLIAAGMPMTINWHMATHYATVINHLGPVGSYSTWAFERDNGILARASYFRGDVHQLAVTAMRRWTKAQLLFGVSLSRSANATEHENEYMDRLTEKLTKKRDRGTLLMEERQGTAPTLTVSLPPPSSVSFDLATVPDFYVHCFYHLQGLGLNVRHHTHVHAPGISFWSTDHLLFSYVNFNGYRFTSKKYTRSQRDRWALVVNPAGELQPARIDYIVQLNLSERFGDLDISVTTVAGVTLLEPADHELLPWSYMSFMLGYRLCEQPKLGDPVTVIPVSSLKTPTAVMPMTTEKGERLVVMSLDKGYVDEDFFPDE